MVKTVRVIGITVDKRLSSEPHYTKNSMLLQEFQLNFARETQNDYGNFCKTTIESINFKKRFLKKRL